MGPEVALITGVASSLMGFMGSRQEAAAYDDSAARQEQAATEARRIEERNAARIEAESAEAKQQEYKAQRKERLTSIARAAASGGVIAGSGSTQAYLDEQKAEHERAIDWLDQSGRSQAQITRSRGRYQERIGRNEAAATRGRAKATRTQGLGRFVSGAGSAVFDYL